MARSAARLKMGYYPLPESEGANGGQTSCDWSTLMEEP
jgi:hypothetical protein